MLYNIKYGGHNLSDRIIILRKFNIIKFILVLKN